MESLNELIKLCIQFKSHAFSIEEFQHKIETIILPVQCKNTLEKEQHNACNKLEEILYCYSTSKMIYAEQVATALMQAAVKEQERLSL